MDAVVRVVPWLHTWQIIATSVLLRQLAYSVLYGMLTSLFQNETAKVLPAAFHVCCAETTR